jgi:hypothetical protein
VRYFVLCSHTRLTPPAYAGGVTSNVRPHTNPPWLSQRCMKLGQRPPSSPRSRFRQRIRSGQHSASARQSQGARVSCSRFGPVASSHQVLVGARCRCLTLLRQPVSSAYLRSKHSAFALCSLRVICRGLAGYRKSAFYFFSQAHGSGSMQHLQATAQRQCLTQQSPRRLRCGLTPRSKLTRYGRRCKAGLRYSVLCSQPSLTAPASAVSFTSNVRLHKNSRASAAAKRGHGPRNP